MIVVEKLTKRFGDRDVVHDISFNVDRGEILGFLGPNGAGKTTTMRVLTCYFPPTSGRAEVAGFDVQKNSLEVRKHVGYMPENVLLYGDMPVESYLHFVSDVKGVSGRERRKHVEEIMDETSLTEVRDYPISKISRGFRQRVGLAQAIVGKPQVLILDEPTVGLDPKQIIEIRALIRKLASRATVILSTHIMQEV
jgi:ABC-2 type transport system ATP-binding protein